MLTTEFNAKKIKQMTRSEQPRKASQINKQIFRLFRLFFN